MKRLFLFFCLILCFSCKFEERERDGYCSYSMKLSKKELSFGAEGGIDSIIMEGSYGLDHYRECKSIWPENEPDYCNDNYCKISRVMKIECSWFSVTQVDEHKLFVSVNENNTNEEKNVNIIVQYGDCNSGFSIVQAPKSPRELWFNAKGGIDSITTEGEWHYIKDRITVGDTVITLVSDKKQYCGEIYPFKKDNKIYICADEIPFVGYPWGITSIEYSWFAVDKPDKKKIIFSVSENKTGKNRKFGISLEAEDYDTNIWFNQSAE